MAARTGFPDPPRIFGGSANPALLRAVCDHLRTAPGESGVHTFDNENVFARFRDDLSGQDVFLLQSFSSPVNASIMELLVMADAARRAAAGRITAVIPFFAYGRTDSRPEPRVPITARLLADLITVAGVDRVVTVDLHASQIQGFFTIPVEELSSLEVFAAHFRGRTDPVVVAPHEGSIRWAKRLADRLALPLAILTKTGDRDDDLRLLGDVAGRPVILIENEIAGGGSVERAARRLVAAGATTVSAAATHAVFADGAVPRLVGAPIEEIVVTDSLPVPAEALTRLPVRRLSVVPLLSEAIRKIHDNVSLDGLTGPAALAAR